mmetsp:Transcript_37033/g.102977  ORF Transcript_37033/g.102977 Transcript_37033/m.102977 type:complete len:217 (+) Transcript_37033:538-1188(+)
MARWNSRGIAGSQLSSSWSCAFSPRTLSMAHLSSSLAAGHMIQPPVGWRFWKACALIKKLLTASVLPRATWWWDKMSGRSTTMVPGAVAISCASASSSLKSCRVRTPSIGPRKTITMAVCRRNFSSHLVTSFSVSGGALSGIPVSCTKRLERWEMSKPSQSVYGPKATPMLVIMLSTSLRLSPSGLSASCAGSVNSAIRAEPSGPRSPSATASGGW